MPELNIGGSSNQNPENPNQIINERNADEPVSTTEAGLNNEGLNERIDEHVSTTTGLSVEELNDANKIKVEIADPDTPIVVFFGPPSCGKTMTLIRLSRYLQKNGYTVEPITSFRPAYDTNYSYMCKNFNSLINHENAAESTNLINFMLVQVMDGGKPLCQILEGPGEYYFTQEEPFAQFPRYVNAIINSKNRKIWAIMLEPDSTNKVMDTEARRNYALKVSKLKTRINNCDKVMFIFNKIDETPFVINPGNIKYPYLLKHTQNLYPGIFSKFMTDVPILKMFKPYDFDFCAFQTGDYSEAADGTRTFEQGPDIYPEKLWNLILKRIRG